MSNVSRRVRKRWAVKVQYTVAASRPDLEFQIDELIELHDIIEAGPSWTEIFKINITYNI